MFTMPNQAAPRRAEPNQTTSRISSTWYAFETQAGARRQDSRIRISTWFMVGILVAIKIGQPDVGYYYELLTPNLNVTPSCAGWSLMLYMTIAHLFTGGRTIWFPAGLAILINVIRLQVLSHFPASFPWLHDHPLAGHVINLGAIATITLINLLRKP
jgi:hypothetical protein